jgi:urea carboxylase system permease
LIVLLAIHAQTGPGVLTHTDGVAAHTSYIWPFLVSTLMACYVMYGFDSAGELSEETRAPRSTAPRSILRALAVSGTGGALLLLVALMAVGNLSLSAVANGGLSGLITTRLGSALGKVILVDVSIAISVCTLAIQTAGSRMLFSLSRDGVLPASRTLQRIGRRGTPVTPSVVIGAVSIGLLALNLGQSAIFLALGSVGVVTVYLAYLGVTGPMLYRRLRGRYRSEPRSSGRFSLGRWGLPINVAAVAWGAFIVVNTAWPRAEVYNPAPPLHWYLRDFSLLFLAAASILGGALHLLARPRPSTAPVAARVEPTRAAASLTDP